MVDLSVDQRAAQLADLKVVHLVVHLVDHLVVQRAALKADQTAD